MRTSTEPTRYSAASIILHWLSALFVIGLFALGYWMMTLTYYSPWYKTAPMWHKSLGLILLLLTLLRVAALIRWKAPKISGQRWEKIAAKSAHHLLYLLLFILFISGYLISTADGRPILWFDWLPIPALPFAFSNQADIAGTIHKFSAYTLIGLSVLHLLAALKHHWINKDNTLKKMLGVSS
ncbi:Cytochrome b561 [Vibrio stylophorae]|uniref:Cytochrome b561 n=1 Tax=Vibrio stylophorae TaxID=659351 RepID=A0ABM8ZQJ3_9VIBR|nr:cytochrome b [Vibrio stylophorae]CAH0532463.1 Cytochrome b561 [Vibrio stylophorae]